MPSTPAFTTITDDDYNRIHIQPINSTLIPEPKFKSRDRVILKKNIDANEWPVFTSEMQEFAQDKKILEIRSKSFFDLKGGYVYSIVGAPGYVWNEKWFEFSGEADKYQDLVEKIDQLWTRQEYYKCLVSK